MQNPLKPDMTVHAGEAMNIRDVATVIARCYDAGGFVHSIMFTGNKVTPTLDPSKVKSEGMYSCLWLLPKEPDPNGNGETLKIAEPEDDGEGSTE